MQACPEAGDLTPEVCRCQCAAAAGEACREQAPAVCNCCAAAGGRCREAGAASASAAAERAWPAGQASCRAGCHWSAPATPPVTAYAAAALPLAAGASPQASAAGLSDSSVAWNRVRDCFLLAWSQSEGGQGGVVECPAAAGAPLQ